MNDTTRLFGKQTKKHWLDIRAKILIDPNNLKVWNDAILLFEQRLKTRYFNPITRILKLNITTGEGFAAMTLLCSLIEFLQSCYEGKTYEYGLSKETDFLYGSSATKFKSFLLEHEPFRTTFSKSLTRPTREIKTFADDFYVNVRCGLFHEAATKNNWTIKCLNKNNSCSNYVDINNEDNKIIYRDKFFEEIKTYCKIYQQKLRNDIHDNNRRALRDNFCRKIDSLCEVDDIKCKWWLLKETICLTKTSN